MIYLVWADELSAVKIGWAQDPEARLKQLQTGCPVKLELIHTFDWPKEAELQLHKCWGKYRKEGEWFHLPVFDEGKPDDPFCWWIQGIMDGKNISDKPITST